MLKKRTKFLFWYFCAPKTGVETGKKLVSVIGGNWNGNTSTDIFLGREGARQEENCNLEDFRPHGECKLTRAKKIISIFACTDLSHPKSPSYAQWKHMEEAPCYCSDIWRKGAGVLFLTGKKIYHAVQSDRNDNKCIGNWIRKLDIVVFSNNWRHSPKHIRLELCTIKSSFLNRFFGLKRWGGNMPRNRREKKKSVKTIQRTGGN